MKSPCRNICVLDQTRGVCTGCLRTLDEIARWSRLSDAERRRIMAELPQRAEATSQGRPEGPR